MAEKWLSIVEYARTYNVSDMTVRRRIKTGKLNAVLQDGKYFIPMKDESKPAATAQPAQQRRPGAGTEMQVIKGHPTPQHTFNPGNQAPQAQARNHGGGARHHESPRGRTVGVPAQQEPIYAEPAFAMFDDDEAELNQPGVIPAGLRRAFGGTADVAMVDARSLLAFCEASMKKHQESERRQVERFKAKLETMEATVNARDGEVSRLKQQLEDLQLLVKVLERKRPTA